MLLQNKALTYSIIYQCMSITIDTRSQMHDDNFNMRICNDCKKTFITQSSIQEHIQATGHKDKDKFWDNKNRHVVILEERYIIHLSVLIDMAAF
jgi:hypothetical protein